MNQKQIEKTIEQFYGFLDGDDNKHRYRSWEHCFNAFNEIFNKQEILNENDLDYLSLHLGFYLASWGMYRGSSFLLRDYDYTIHKECVKILFEYKDLLKKDIFGLDKVDCLNLLFERDCLYDKLWNYYKNLNTKTKKVSTTLITKIIMGTLGCSPAYDRFFNIALSKFKIKKTKKGKPNIEALIEFVNKNTGFQKAFNNKLKEITSKRQVNYTKMKILDMFFWQYGKDNYKSDLKTQDILSFAKKVSPNL